MTSRRLAGPSSSSLGMTGFGNFGGAFLLLNALSSRIYRLIEDSTQTIVAGYEQGGLIGLVQSPAFRALIKRYLWLLGVAFTFERIRKFWSWLNLLGTFTNYLYITATLKPGDQSYEWVLAFWEQSSAFKSRSRDFLIETGSKSKKKRSGISRHIEQSIYGGSAGEATGKDDEALVTRLSPRDNSEQYIWHKGTLFRFRRWLQATPASRWDGGEMAEQSVISVRSYAFTRAPLFKLLESAKEVFETTKPQMITIRVLDQNRGTWRRVAYRHRRPLETVIMDEERKEELLQDAKEFLLSESWYNQRGISWKRGYLLNGPPGTGKSSTIQAIASEVKLDVYVLSINSPMMNDASLQSAFRSIPPKSIVVIEDVDALNIQKRNLPNPRSSQVPQRAVYRGGGVTMQHIIGGPNPTISLSALLNCIDGVEGNDGRLLFLTTNAISTLDPALVRAGRVDLLIDYKLATQTQAAQLFEIFYTPSQAVISDDILNASNNNNNKKTDPADSSDTKIAPQPFDLPDDITKEDISKWAKTWASHLPEDAFSIAELQGMLLAYKKDPQGASLAMPNWIEKEIQRKKQEEEEKEKARKEQEEEEKKAEEEAAKKESQVASASLIAKKASIRASKEPNGSKASPSTSQGETVVTPQAPAVNGHLNGIHTGGSSTDAAAGSSQLGSVEPSPSTYGQDAVVAVINGTSKGKEPESAVNGSAESPAPGSAVSGKQEVTE